MNVLGLYLVCLFVIVILFWVNVSMDVWVINSNGGDRLLKKVLLLFIGSFNGFYVNVDCNKCY